MFNKVYNHISDRIDQVYKELTKGKASPMGGVAYLTLEVLLWKIVKYVMFYDKIWFIADRKFI